MIYSIIFNIFYSIKIIYFVIKKIIIIIKDKLKSLEIKTK